MYWKPSAVTHVPLIDFLSWIAQGSNLCRCIYCGPGIYIYSWKTSFESKKQKLERWNFILISHQKLVFCHASLLNRYSTGLAKTIGRDVCWMDGRLFPLDPPADRNSVCSAPRGTDTRGTHIYLLGNKARNLEIEIWIDPFVNWRKWRRNILMLEVVSPVGGTKGLLIHSGSSKGFAALTCSHRLKVFIS